MSDTQVPRKPAQDAPKMSAKPEAQLVDRVKKGMEKRDDLIEIGSEDESEDESDPPLPTREVVTLCQTLERECLRGSVSDSLGLIRHLRQYRAALLREETRNATQTEIDSYFTV
ncbi:hypothetical protein FISHEDRAFT_75463 [Fistulina hepatica ATCC 64428]|uniref:Uncharacterized protein n=1 Tax=Fistulina hepatica ATCC 64428 TaxID=1128425 RepID=A0A0D7A756_9AGAR|nr:hypothetical protein FISHEDRAFT_75463 [Fistulina hepatica ATCC 64428]